MAVVYKYRKPGRRALDILENQRLWLSAPVDFNDPSDMRLPIAGLFDSSFDVTFRELVRISFEQDPKQRVVDVLNDTSRALEQGRLYEELRNGTGARLLDEVRRESGVLSCAATDTNLHLWEKYADNDRGVCYGFETRVLGFKADPVIYIPETETPVAKYFESEPIDLRTATCLVKYDRWSREEEVRIIIPRCARTYLLFDKCALVSVTLGANAPTKFRRRLHHILAERYPGVAFAKREFKVADCDLERVDQPESAKASGLES